MGEKELTGPELVVANARRAVDLLSRVLDEGRLAVHLLPTDDFGGAINYVLPEEVTAHCADIEAQGRRWQIVPVKSVESDLAHAQKTVAWYDGLEKGFV